MKRAFWLGIGAASVVLSAGFLTTGCGGRTVPTAENIRQAPLEKQVDRQAGSADHEAADEEHAHKPGEHGGLIISLGRDSYHIEAIITKSGELQLYTLGSDETRVKYIELQELTAYVKATDVDTESINLAVKARPQPGDSDGKTSLFVAQLPESLIGKPIDVTIPNIAIDGERFRLGFTTKVETHASMPAKVTSEEERELYLTPGGAYTAEDIAANGNQTASQKFAGFMAAHDLKPQPGEKICPITLTKANEKCAWIVGGKEYQFCCPPCVDEFVRLAKTKPVEVLAPEDYVKAKD